MEENLHRLEKIITVDICDIFNSKDSFLFLTLFERFTGFGIADIKFAGFLRGFKTNMRNTRKNDKGMLFDEIDKDKSTKDAVGEKDGAFHPELGRERMHEKRLVSKDGCGCDGRFHRFLKRSFDK